MIKINIMDTYNMEDIKQIIAEARAIYNEKTPEELNELDWF